MATPVVPAVAESTNQPKKHERPRRGEVREPKQTRIERQRGHILAQMIEEMPTTCDWGTKCNARGFKVSLILNPAITLSPRSANLYFEVAQAN